MSKSTASDATMQAGGAALPKTKEIVSLTFTAVKEYSRLAGQIPADDYEYHQAFSGFRNQVRDHSALLIDVMDKCCHLLPKRRRITLDAKADPVTGAPPSLSETERVAVMEAVDSLLENVDSVLDELQGRKLHAADQLSVSFGSELKAAPRSAAAIPDSSRGGVIHVAHVMRPQLIFEMPVDNFSPFVPVYYDAQGVRHTGKAGVHPFEEQIKSFMPSQDQLLPHTETPSLPLAECPLRFVDAVEDLQEVIQSLMKEKEIAIDLEHHDFYSYQGFTCLMQISTRTADIIVDCLQLRSSMHLLAPVFLNSGILKVLHGAREDVRWLQKDFGLYLVNFFDTGIALQTLHMPHSLAFAVDHFCQVKLNKKFQTADWRVRPLSAEMVHYARQDTHFLLYVYDRLKALLLNSEARASVGNLLVHVFRESRRLSLDVYQKPELYSNESYKAALGRSLGGLNAAQTRVVRDIFNWRDGAAREVDDSPPAVLHLSSVLAIASKLPTSASELLRCCSPVSATVRKNVGHLVELVKAALADCGAGAAATSSAGTKTDGAGAQDGQGVGPGDESMTTMSARARAVAVHRPMTGTLPSIASSVGPSLADGREAEETKQLRWELLRDEQPSLWFASMQRLAAVLAARPTHSIALPGSDVSAALAKAAALKQQRQQERKSKATEQEDALGSPAGGAASSGNDEKDEREEVVFKTAVETDQEKKPEAQLVGLDGAAISLRQAHGTGAKNRKKTAGNKRVR